MIISKVHIITNSRIIYRILFRTYKTDQVRVRFAPSPTGYLHLGGLRTALYNLLFAKKYNGKFILRIEDTDQTRIVPGAADQLQNDLIWSGIEIDEGPSIGGPFGPYLQSERLKIYRDKVQILLENGSAYHCFCTDNRLQLLRREALRKQEIPKYDNKCRHLTPEASLSRLARGDPSCIRFKISDEEQSFEDLIYGNISYNISLNEGDPVIIKSDGYPTYHFANVVDDHLMNISHVLRGAEWQISTTKHILLYRAFNWSPPLFGHLPLLMNADGTKLSKRQGDIRIGHYRDSHIFSLALLNFIVHSGGGFAKDLERHLKPKCYTLEELAEQFDISKINSHSGKLMVDRLLEFNKLELKKRIHDEDQCSILIKEAKHLLKSKYPERVENNSIKLQDEYIENILKWASNRISKLSDLLSKDLEFIWVIPTEYNVDESTQSKIALLRSDLENEDIELSIENLNSMLKSFCKNHTLKYGHFMKNLRYILSGLKEGPSVAEMVVILGKENTIERLDLFLNKTKS